MSVEENIHLQPKGHKRYQEIVTAISGAIREGRYAAGERLPGERELAKEFGVGRSAIREAMVALEVHGLVEAKHGAGLFIAASPILKDAASSDLSAVEIFTTRRLCEGEAAALAAVTITDVDLAKLAKAVRDIKARYADEAVDVATESFHLTMAQATDNSAIVHVIANLLQMQRSSGSCSELIRRVRSGRVQTWHHDYLRIFRAVRARDSAAARSALHEHFDHVLEAVVSLERQVASQRTPAA
jgi:GntR family transcriptional regulator, hexuronate regulon transcriptional repressor